MASPEKKTYGYQERWKQQREEFMAQIEQMEPSRKGWFTSMKLA
ncbi:protein of unknown function [Limnospira indica PCC 8005]|uniref:Uncharacterized protein n=1 Tax=Limnospira indica PCC 8005 TaxID=376219 RepID=A0A9P1KE01_9CYAN|nr:protein of unknown function [Limnospira indica PCC 8005]